MKTLLKTLVACLVACNAVVALVKVVQKHTSKENEEDGIENDSVCDEVSNDVENNADLSEWMKATKNMCDAMTRLDDVLKRKAEIESKFESDCAKASLSKKDEMT